MTVAAFDRNTNKLRTDMQTIRLKIGTAIDLANWINDIARKHTSDEIPYIEIKAGDPSGAPEGSDFVEANVPLNVTIGDDDV